MSVVIRGMKIPISCDECPCHDMNEGYHRYCYAYDVIHDGCGRLEVNYITRPEGCPLVELPEHHGDLIDRRDVLDSCEFIGEPPSFENPYSESYACKSEVIESISAIIEEE